jgi:hypothetical protein
MWMKISHAYLEGLKRNIFVLLSAALTSLLLYPSPRNVRERYFQGNFVRDGRADVTLGSVLLYLDPIAA